MPWWALGYSAAFLALTVWSLVEDHRAGRGLPILLLDLLVSAVWLYLLAAYFHPSLVASLGRGVALLFGAVLVATGLRTQQDIVALDQAPDPELSPRLNLIGDLAGIGLGVLFLAPALVLSTAVVVRVW